VVAKTLVEENIKGGRRLIENLDREMDIHAAFWLYLPEGDLWRLYLASPEVDLKGSRVVYTQVQKALSKMAGEDLPALEDITAISPKDRLVQAIGSAIKTGPGFAKLRLTGNSFNNTYIDDAVIYRMNIH
jgi:hypothetical protein